jgi:NTP pyrophosphatase (non-canonical NTP hydrolase)
MTRWKRRVDLITEVKHRDNDVERYSWEDLRFNALALCGEAGELANVVKKHWRGDPPPEFIESCWGELADVIIYAYILAQILGKDMDQLCEEKVLELMDRWPDCAQRIREAELASA